MSSDHTTVNRRQFVQIVSAASIGATWLAATGSAMAGGHLPKVDPNDAQAKGLKYTHESTNPDQRCNNCQLYKGAADSAWAECQIFPGKEVAGKGLCSAWVKKTG